MNIRSMVFTLIAVIVLAPAAVLAQAGAPGTCPSDSKLLNGGPTLVYGEGPGTFWGLVIGGLDAARFATDEEKIGYLSQVFGQEFMTLDEARQYNLDQLSIGFDANQNGFVCAYELRGTRAYSGDPFINLTTFGISDDKLRKK